MTAQQLDSDEPWGKDMDDLKKTMADVMQALRSKHKGDPPGGGGDSDDEDDEPPSGDDSDDGSESGDSNGSNGTKKKKTRHPKGGPLIFVCLQNRRHTMAIGCHISSRG